MKLICIAILLSCTAGFAQTPGPNSQYRPGPDSLAQDGVPKGEIRGPYTLPSHVYPGTQHTYWVYVPAQYDPAFPASLMVFQDGQAFKDENGDLRAQNVMDNLIYRREIPVMIGVFINPGRTPEQPEPTPQNWGDQTTNRPAEYNTPDDKYARVITEELMPVLYKEYNISKDPEQHGIGGSSSGAIAAFMVAWERPNDFRKVLSNVGSFVNIRGGNVYPERVLASEKKPIRVFLCDGRNDNRGVGRDGVYDEKRDWFLQNVRLMKALTQKGYDVNYTWGMNLHGQKFGGAIMPEMMRWLWRDGPVSTDPNDMVERSFRQPAKMKFPEAEISNSQIHARVYLPDADQGYYRATRFDWSGVIPSLKWNGHEYFGQWFDRYDPKLHDSITGPVEEFLTNGAGLGYADAKPGDTFVKIGVGSLRKPDEPSFRQFGTYEIVDPGKWTVRKGTDWIEFQHELTDPSGYAYVYTKRVSLTSGKPELVLQHSLRNTGRKTIESSVYEHNFYMLDGAPSSSDVTVTLPFAPRLTNTPGFGGMAEVRGNQIAYLKELARGDIVQSELTGFGATSRDYDIRVENRRTGAGVRQTADRPISRFNFWSIRTTVSPEAFITMSIAPGQEFTWRIAYEFYEAAR